MPDVEHGKMLSDQISVHLPLMFNRIAHFMRKCWELS